MNIKGTLGCLIILFSFTGCSEVVSLVHDTSQKSQTYQNLGTLKVDLFSDPGPEDAQNGSLRFTPPVNGFLLSTIKTKIVQSDLFSLSDSGEYELSGKITRFQSAAVLSAGRMVFGCMGLAVYFAGSVLAIAKSDATYFYVGTGVTPILIGAALLFDTYDQASVAFEYAVKKDDIEIFRGTVNADSTLERPGRSRMALLDQLSNRCIDQMLQQINKSIK